MKLTEQRRRSRRQSGVVVALCGCLAWASASASAGSITNVTVVNVTPAGFDVVWRAAADTTPSITVFADAGGVTNLAGRLGAEAFPLHTGNPDLAAGYERRLGRAALRQKTQGHGLMMMRVTGCRPNTTYYYRLASTPTLASPEVYPTSGPLPAVTTPRGNTFVANHQQLIIDVADLNTEGRVVLLTHTNAAYPLAAVIGDGVRTNQVFFDANDLFDLADGGNFTGLGMQDFVAEVLGPNQSSLSQHFALNFTASFAVAQATLAAIGTEFFAAAVGSTIVLFGQNGAVAINGNSSVGLAAINLSLEIPPGHLTNFTLQALAPELDAGASTVTPQGGSSWLLHFVAQPGQSFSGDKPLGQLSFSGGPDRASAFVPLRVTGLTATKPDASSVAQVVSASGRVVMVGDQPLLEALRSDPGSRTLLLYGRPNAAYAVEYANEPSGPNSWRFWVRVPMTGPLATLRPTQPVEPAVFYRAYEFMASPPILEALLETDRSGSVLLYGVPGRTYRLEQTASLGPAPAWTPGPQLLLTNSFTFVRGLSVTTNIFFRAHSQ